jgi:DNA-binding beta-propeller fold protein YncE
MFMYWKVGAALLKVMKIVNTSDQTLGFSRLARPELSSRIRLYLATDIFLLLILAFGVVPCHAQPTIVPYTFTTIAVDGNGGYADGAGASAQFNFPQGIALDKAGNIHVADSGNNVIRELKPSGVTWTVTTLAGQSGIAGFADSLTDSGALFNSPQGVAVDSVGNVFVADACC